MISFCIPVLPYSKEIVDITNQTLERLHLFTESEFEICLCINGSSDYVHNLDTDLADKIVNFEEPVGNPSGWNNAVLMAEGDIICFMDNDLWCDEGWDKPILEALKEQKLGIATPYLYWYKENVPTRFIDDNFQGCCMWMRRDTLETLGYAFDPRFDPAYAEDTDLFLRARLFGFDRQRIKGSTAFHWRGATCYKVFEKYGGIEEVAKVSRKKYEDKWRHLGEHGGGSLKCWELWR